MTRFEVQGDVDAPGGALKSTGGHAASGTRDDGRDARPTGEKDEGAASHATGSDVTVRVVGIEKVIDERPILRGIDLTLGRGESLALLGPNGAGKTTLLHVLSTLSPPSGGRLELFGKAVRRSGAAGVRRRLAMIAHQAMLYRDLTAIENLVFFGKLYGVSDVEARAWSMLERVDLADRAHDAAKTFSRGMVQRLAIARSMMHGPELLLADEPFAGLDVRSAGRLEALLESMRDEGTTLIVSNHDVRQSLSLTQQYVVIRAGEVVMRGRSDETPVTDVIEEVAKG